MKWSQRLALLLAVPLALAVAGLMLSATAAWAWTCPSVVFTLQPTTTQVNTAMTPAVVVQVESSGNVDQSYNGPVTLTYAADQIGAPEPTGNTVNADQGVATFSNLTFSGVGFGFELQASIPGNTTSLASTPFDIVSELVQCSADQSCQSGTVSSAGTSASVTAAAADSSAVLTATGGGFQPLSCTTYGGVVTFSVQNRSAVITLTLSSSVIHSQHRNHTRQFNICWGSPTPFTTLNGTTSVFNSANDEYEGLLPSCRANGGSEPCIRCQQQHDNRDKCHSGNVVTTIDAPPGDPHMTY
jgi:hypothetical protein